MISIAELAHLVRDLLAPGKPVRILGTPLPAAARNRYVPSIAKIQALHGLRVSVPLAESIIRGASAHRPA